MKTNTEVFFFGSLRREHGGTQEFPTHFEFQEPLPLRELLHRLQIASDLVQLAMVNHRAVSPDHVIRPGDRVSLFPREYAVFADWKNLRF